MNKKLFRFAAVAAVLLAFCLVFMMPVGADTVEVSSNDNLADKINGAKSGDRITLTGPVTVDGSSAIVIDKSLTLDLNGYTLTSNVVNNRTFWIVKDGVTFTIDGTVGNSKIEMPGSRSYGIVDIKADAVSLIVNGGTYTGIIDDGALFRGQGSPGVSYDNLVIILNNANVDINGGRVLSLYYSYAKEVAVIGGKYKTTTLAFAIAGSAISSPLTFTDVNVDVNGSNSPLIEIVGMTAMFDNCKFSSNALEGTGSAPPEVISLSFNSQVTLNSGSYISTVESPVIGIYTSGGSITLDSGVVLKSPTSVIEVYNSDGDSYEDDEYSISIKDAKITGTPLITHPNGNEEDTDISITGGTFSTDVSKYLADNCVCVSNGENSFVVMEKPEYAVVPEVPEVTIPEAGNVIEADGSTITPSTNDASVDEPISITISSSDSSAGTYDIVVSNVEKVGDTYKTTAESGLSVVQKVPQDVGGAGIKFQLSVDVKNASNALPVINPEMKEEVLDKVEEKISGDKKFHAMITAEEGNLEAVNDNIEHSKGKTVKITFTVPAGIISNPNLLVAYHVKGDDVTEVGLECQPLDSGGYKITITGSGFSSYVLVEEEPQKSSGGAVDTGSGNYQYYPRSVPTDGIVDFGTSRVVTGMELPAGSDGTVTLNIKPDFAMPENGFYAFEIDAPGYNLDAKINGGLSFQIPVADLEAAGWTAEDIVLFHGTVAEDGKIVWEALPTNLVKNENGVAYYKAAINSCSPFYIGFVKDGSVVNTEVVDPVTPETPVTPDEPEVLPPVDEPETPEQPTESPAPILAVLAGLGAAAVLRRK